MAKVFELNSDGVRALLKSSEMMGVLEGYGKSALGRLPDGYEMTSQVGKNRITVQIEAVTNSAKIDNRKNNSLLKSLRG